MKKLNQTQALAKWMKSGKWITGKTAYNELRITRLPEIMGRLKCLISLIAVIEEKTVTVNTIYGKPHIKKWRVDADTLSSFRYYITNYLLH